MHNIPHLITLISPYSRAPPYRLYARREPRGHYPMCGYAGFPVTLNAMKTLMEVLEETEQTLLMDSCHAGIEGRYDRGKWRRMKFK
ncbi:MAG TPA: hypothetical protein VN372_07215 [Methanospirillum sp.]|nr:hypothetical protein [Methanospirillum sp.]